ncbi:MULTISPECIES: DMT family transporter [Micromonospora]|uniref:EamA/RhaT family transporter n=1 Tax=Micromonospora solifontis TaxID=2487138 RepID=A0ABX9WGU3_9ACTN|nr:MULTISPECIES: EamA family transporter [Micromonospora]NES14646.1 EamA family transporter [Micromonospora sp. PPF5-17B]NES36628.1 EamA family transporter [Micromonospora solifontis]NES55654.1 EamA family transporter [Micromonospora sp. PPF5-6]RNL99224.1 EamA/RhaT family transporter [Micromonospora solifontis]
MRERSGVGLGLALLSALTFATSGTFARPLITGEWSAEAVVLARVGIAALVLAVPALMVLRGRWPVLRRNAGTVVVFGLLGVALAQACFFNAVRYLPVGVALLLEYLGIVLVVGWMWLVHGQRPRLLTVVGSLAALAGLVGVLDLTGAGRLDPVGVLWGLGAGVGLAGYFVIAGRVDAELPSVVMASGGMAVGALVLLVLGVVGVLPLHAGTADVTFSGHRMSWLVPIAGLSLIAAVVAYLTGVAGARILGARLSSFVGLTEVMFAVLIAWLVLGELPTGVQLLGGGLIVAGVALVRLDELRAAPEASASAATEPVLAAER